MPDDLMTTREVARHLGINEKQVYALVKEKRIPATRVTGKWLFPRRLIDEWLESDARKGLAQARDKGRRVAGALLAAGSNDPVLDILGAHIKKAHPEFYLFISTTGSSEGLRALNSGHIDLAFCHLYDPASGEYNLPFFPALAPDISPVAVNLFHRDLGLVTATGNPRRLKGFADLAKKGVRIVNRQAGAGTRLLLDQNLSRLKIRPERLAGYDREAFTHFEAALAVLGGEADVALATGSAASLLGLAFVPLARERFDAVLTRETYFTRPFQALLETLRSAAFRARVEKMGHYDFADSGALLTPEP
jgi:putative molybdopterin biosynthesis protein